MVKVFPKLLNILHTLKNIKDCKQHSPFWCPAVSTFLLLTSLSSNNDGYYFLISIRLANGSPVCKEIAHFTLWNVLVWLFLLWSYLILRSTHYSNPWGRTFCFNQYSGWWSLKHNVFYVWFILDAQLKNFVISLSQTPPIDWWLPLFWLQCKKAACADKNLQWNSNQVRLCYCVRQITCWASFFTKPNLNRFCYI